MGPLKPAHLLDQAERLIAPARPGPPRQVDIRRFSSSAYYAVFHKLLTVASDEFVGASGRNVSSYALVYRAIDHRGARDLCVETLKPSVSAKYRPHLPAGGVGSDLRIFARALVELQGIRHAADYDPSITVTVLDARLAIDAARDAIEHLDRAPAEERRFFITLLCFPPR